MLAYLKRMLAYDDWANREVLASLLVAEAPSERSVRLLSHILAAERLWWGRLQRDRERVPVWPDFDLVECEERIREVAKSWQEYLASRSQEDLREMVSYTNSQGEPWSSSVLDILVHVVLHSTYHRGQLAGEISASGLTAPYTDFIHCTRQGFLD